MEYNEAEPDGREVARELIELIRIETDLPYHRCRSCALTIVGYLRESLSDARQPLADVAEQLHEVLTGS